MEQILNYVKPELLIVTAALYFIGMWIKQTEYIKDKYIPLILGILGIIFFQFHINCTLKCILVNWVNRCINLITR